MIRVVSLIVVGLVLTACVSNPFEVVVSRCPAVAIVGDTGVYTAFNGESENVEDILHTATILNVGITCEEAEFVRATVSFDIGVNGGAANTADTVTLPFFVAVLRDNNNLVSKQSYSVTYRFDRDGSARGKEVITQLIPTIEQARRYNYEVLIGFELDPADIAFNMRR